MELSECTDKTKFMAVIGPLYEESPWVAERAFGPAYATATTLAAALAKVEKKALLCAHPDLAGKAALAKTLTAESTAEQASCGLDSLTQAELTTFGVMNGAYRAKFGWPFILAVRNASKRAILGAFARRLPATVEEELKECVAQVHKIAWMRLLDAVACAPTGKLTCHVLDTANGCPAAGMVVTLARLSAAGEPRQYTFVTNADGRLDGPALAGAALAPGAYEWQFHVGEYYTVVGNATTHATPFLDVVPIRFGIDNPETHYHVPLLCSPWTFSTYRGS